MTCALPPRGLSFAFSPRSVVLSLDAFYRTDVVDAQPCDFEDAALFDFIRIVSELQRLKSSYRTVFVEGIVLLANPDLVSLLDMIVVLDVSDDVARERRMRRDIEDRSPWNTPQYFDTHVWPAHLRYMKQFGDMGKEKPRLVMNASLSPQQVLCQAKEFVKGIVDGGVRGSDE